jgi:Uma2 family endonuclease
MIAQPKQKYTLEEYLELDEKSEEKFEYWDGNVWTMSGASLAHNTIVKNFLRRLDERLEKHGCRVFPSDMRIFVPDYPPYRYPDVTALCGRPEIKKTGNLELLTNPQLIVEVLSDSTEGFDRGDKFSYYKSIESFTEYLLVAQHRPHVSQFIKQGERFWNHTEYNDLEESVALAFAPCEIKLGEIYREVEFAERPFFDDSIIK